jgi:hypothetical protein
MATFVVRRQTLRQLFEPGEIESLITRGFLKPALHRSVEPVLSVSASARIPPRPPLG